MDPLRTTLKHLADLHGPQSLPPSQGPFELVLWENACYLTTEENRLEVFLALRDLTTISPNRIDPHRIAAATDDELMPLAILGGKQPQTRIFRWHEIAQITLDDFGGNLDTILTLPFDDARTALQQFPNIRGTGAEKILLFCGIAQGLPVESNGLRVLVRLGWGYPMRDYVAMYREVQSNLAGTLDALPSDVAELQQAYLLLKLHGQQICTDKEPSCSACPLESLCYYPKELQEQRRSTDA